MLDEHLTYVADVVRREHYKAAFGKVVRPGDRVADLGSGSGILGLMCLQAGAGRVHFVDDSAMIEIARQSVARAGLGGKASFIYGRSEQVSLPERVDVVVCDHVGLFGFDYGIVRLFRDARRRFLTPGGALIPGGIELQIAAIESDSCHKLAEGWCTEGVPAEFHWLRDYCVNAKHAVNLKREELLGSPAALGRIGFGDDGPELSSWTAELRVERDGVVHGLGGWFDCELARGVWMTNSPLAEKPIRRSQIFLPIDKAAPVRAGDRVKATVMARSTDNLIAWIVEFPSTGMRFSHSTWQGMLFSPEDLLHSDPTRVPQPNHAGLARTIVLGYCDGRRTAQEIEQAVLLERPDLFPSAEEVSRFVAHVLRLDTR